VNNIGQNLQWIKERMTIAADSCGRSPDDILLLAISKTFPIEAVAQAVEAGLRHFGENRVQEAEAKILHFHQIVKLEWHLVGHLQSNKAKRAAELFDVIHSVDNAKLAAKLDQACGELRKSLSILLQVDLGKEVTKFGADVNQVREIVAAVSHLKNIRLDGLMTIPPFFENPDDSRPFFVQLREMRDTLESDQPGCLGKKHLSMGMSHDFEAAIQEGATIVRIGTAVFGSRQ
jgi:PLP dependent protein